ncbi:hypothetical protein V7S43_010266 [Phytophthora oleae]|uniref:BED-type domain-containing protein n=1 Tax=Phytophthora oleae TaxID=2107226 RepID=A0ABD3FDX2_9STRA
MENSDAHTDQCDILLYLEHHAQTNHPAWQIIHTLGTPVENLKDNPHTHICTLCKTLLRLERTSNASAHIKSQHPVAYEFIAKRKQEKLELRAQKKAKKGITPEEQVAKTGELTKWLITLPYPFSMLQDAGFQHLIGLPRSALPTVSDLNSQVQGEFATFNSLLTTYLASESKKTYRVALPDAEKALLLVALGFMDSKWRRVDLVLAVRVVPRGSNQQVKQLVTQTVSEVYGHSISEYTRNHVGIEDDTPSVLAAGSEYEGSSDAKEDLLTHTLRRCVEDALGAGSGSSFRGETNVLRILRLLQELLRFFKAPDRSNSPQEVPASSICSSALSSIGRHVELLRVSCAPYRAYWLYVQSNQRPTAAEPELEAA